MSSQPQSFITEEEYLAIERGAETKSEYFAGAMFALAGASRRHNRIVTNLVTSLDSQLKERPCNVYSSNLRVRINQTGLYTYPDVVVTCGEEMFSDEHHDVLLNPQVIIEVLSDSTEAYDRGEKFEHYQQVESLAEYLLVSQHACRVEKYLRQDQKSWLYSEAHEVEERIEIESIACLLALRDVYDKVDLARSPDRSLHRLR
ncbi:MAG TPA: Uma2 family endonuclease [Pyrinomonadaceae bacterium]|jgi:Uma2 family endonuclease|nr:Uma2 family endonuclease [Pyrinomonadaceae bacterium]